MVDIVLGAVTKAEYTFSEAKKAIAGYAFGEHTLAWETPAGPRFGEEPRGDVRSWAYGTYDCVRGNSGPLDAADVLLTAGLNSKINSAPAATMLTVAPDVSECLSKLEGAPPFWLLPEEHFEAKGPTESDHAWWIWRAWWLLIGVKGAKVAVVHKTLHHKDPAHFPLLDSVTKRCYRKGQEWLGIHHDLNKKPTQAKLFGELEEWFAGLAERRGEIALTRLRLHDILLWIDQVDGGKQRPIAIAKGEEFVT